MAEKKEADPFTLKKLTQLVEDVATVNSKLTEITYQENELKKEKSLLLGQIFSALKEANLPNFRTHRGLVSIRKNWDCKVPKEPQKKEAFYAWLREQGWFDEWISVNSKTLNSQYKKLYEEHAKKGELFEIPGIGAPSFREQCVLTKG